MPGGDSLPTLAYCNNYQGTERLDSAVELAAVKTRFIFSCDCEQEVVISKLTEFFVYSR